MDTSPKPSAYVFDHDHVPHTHKLLFPTIAQCLKKYAIQSVLDIGCGNGYMCRHLLQHVSKVVGIDSSASGIDEARLALPETTFHRCAIGEAHVVLKDQLFDLVLATEVIEHLFLPRELPQLARQHLKPRGIFILSTPYHGYWKNLALSLLNGWDRHHTVSWDGGHIKFWSRVTLEHLLKEEGFEILEFHGCGRFHYLWASMIIVARKK